MKLKHSPPLNWSSLNDLLSFRITSSELSSPNIPILHACDYCFPVEYFWIYTLWEDLYPLTFSCDRILLICIVQLSYYKSHRHNKLPHNSNNIITTTVLNKWGKTSLQQDVSWVNASCKHKNIKITFLLLCHYWS